MAFTSRDHVRAALLALVLAVHGYLALPIPGKVSEASFKHPIADEELARWSGILSGVGIERTPDELKVELIERFGGLAEARKESIKPIRPLLRLTGTGQAWGLFTYPNSFPHTMHIQLQVDGQWRPLYLPLDPEHDWNKRLFVFRRIRGVYDDNANNARQSYDNFVDWVALMALREHPEASAVQVHYVRGHVTLPGEPKDPSTKEKHKRVRTRAGFEQEGRL